MFAFIESGVITEYPIGLAQIRKKYPNTSFPKDLTNADLNEFGVVEVVSIEHPATFTDTQKVQEVDPVYGDGVWTQSYEIIPLTDEELDEITTQQEESIKNERNSLLFQSDWTQLSDSPLTDEEKELWAIYRQDLRDITTQSNYPEDVAWPAIPN